VAVVTVTATDQLRSPRKNSSISSSTPTPPNGCHANDGVLVSVGSQFDYEATKAGTVFADANGDALTIKCHCEAALRHFGLRYSRDRQFQRSRISRSDGHGIDGYGELEDVFALSAPDRNLHAGPADDELPYADPELPLPYVFSCRAIGHTALDTQPRTTNERCGRNLGRVLFYDKRLSSTNTASCASCHQHDSGFTTSTPFATGPSASPRRAM